MTVNIPPTVIPTKWPRRQRFRRPWNTDPDVRLCYMPEVNTSWIDQSTHGNDGTIDGAAIAHNCRYGEGLYFDGVDDGVNAGSDASLDITDEYTLAAWFYPMTLPAGVSDQTICKKKFDELRIFIEKNTNRVRAYTTLTTGSFSPQYDLPAANVWYHGVITVESGYQAFYVNNDLKATQNRTGVITVAAANPLGVGVSNLLNSEYFHGYIDEVLLINRAFDASEVAALYEAGRPYEV